MPSPIKPDRAAALRHLHKAEGFYSVVNPVSKWMAVGHLSEAEWKLAGLSHEVMTQIRDARHGIEKSGITPDWDAITAAIEGLPL